jgi:hypothetical protein
MQTDKALLPRPEAKLRSAFRTGEMLFCGIHDLVLSARRGTAAGTPDFFVSFQTLNRKTTL